MSRGFSVDSVCIAAIDHPLQATSQAAASRSSRRIVSITSSRVPTTYTDPRTKFRIGHEVGLDGEGECFRLITQRDGHGSPNATSRLHIRAFSVEDVTPSVYVAVMFDRYALEAAVEQGKSFTWRFFWKPTLREDGATDDACFSQWWQSDFVVDGIRYQTAEHWMMAGKARLFRDEEVLEEILAVNDPRTVKALGRKVRNFDEDTWKKHRFDLVVDGNIAKFSQEPSLLQHMRETGDAVLVEASPLDRIWGIGMGESNIHAVNPARWQGLNLLGFALMKARHSLR